MGALKQQYREKILPAMMESGKYTNIMTVPKLQKIVLNLCLDQIQGPNKDILKSLAEELGQITGQRAVFTKARTSISNFKLREEMEIGATVTLRGNRMYEFLDRFINGALPRVRDFRGVNGRGFDGRGNFSLGIDDQSIFPELNPDKIKKTQGLQVTIVTTATTNEEGYELLEQFGMPFAKIN